MLDVHSILNGEASGSNKDENQTKPLSLTMVTKKVFIKIVYKIIHNFFQTSSKKQEANAFKRPEGMHRELFNLLRSSETDLTSIMPTEIKKGYRNPKAQVLICILA